MDIAPDRRMVKIKARVYPNKIAICMIAEPPEDNFARALSEKANIKQYIDSEIERFRGILSDDQSMNLWKHISEFKPGELTNDLLGGGCIISH